MADRTSGLSRNFPPVSINLHISIYLYLRGYVGCRTMSCPRSCIAGCVVGTIRLARRKQFGTATSLAVAQVCKHAKCSFSTRGRAIRRRRRLWRRRGRQPSPAGAYRALRGSGTQKDTALKGGRSAREDRYMRTAGSRSSRSSNARGSARLHITYHSKRWRPDLPRPPPAGMYTHMGGDLVRIAKGGVLTR